jgi:two-component system response regulator FlrC
MSSKQSAQFTLWLDPLQPLTSDEHQSVSGSGLHVRRIQTLEELQSALTEGQSLALIIRHEPSNDLLANTIELMKRMDVALPVVCRIDRRHLELAVQAMRLGAAHVLAFDDWAPASWTTTFEAIQTAHQAAVQARLQAQLQATVKAATASSAYKKSNATNYTMAATQSTTAPAHQRSVVYVDPVSRHLLALAQRVAQANVTALIEGPTGAGKEILARVLHESSKRAKGPFVGLNCAALPEQLIDDMLFGHEKGAFTGAQKEFKGLFEQAQGGTLFLDEIGEMPLHLQAKLLRVLQERQLTRLGSEQAVDLDVRVIAATNKDLRVAMAEREFREDLYFRISTFKLRVPALRNRPGDILPLVASLLVRHGQSNEAFTMSEEAQSKLVSYPWPGNVRELENVVQRAVVLCSNNHIELGHLMFDDASEMLVSEDSSNLKPSEGFQATRALSSMEAERPTALTGALPSSLPSALPSVFPTYTEMPAAQILPAANLQEAVKSNEHQLILAAIETTESRIEAARKLGISPRTLRYKMAKLKLDTPNLATAY